MVDDEMHKAMRDWSTPSDVHDIRSFHGLATFYRQFVRTSALLLHPLLIVSGEVLLCAWKKLMKVFV